MGEAARQGPGMVWQVRTYRDGSSTATPHKVEGHTFAEGVEARGYNLQATLLVDTLSQVDIPKLYMRVFWTLVRELKLDGLGYVRLSQRQLIEKTKKGNTRFSSGHVSMAMSYWQDMRWIRLVSDGRGGLYQINPFLVFRGKSGPQQTAQMEWIAATEGVVCYIPDHDHLEVWAAERAMAGRDERMARNLPFGVQQLTLIEHNGHASTHKRLMVVADLTEASPTGAEQDPLEELRAPGLTVQQRVAVAVHILKEQGRKATRTEVLALTAQAGIMLKEQSVKSALGRLNRRQRNAREGLQRGRSI